MDRLAEQLAAEQALLGRLEVTRRTVVEVLAENALPGGDAVVADPDPQAGKAATPKGSRVGGQVPAFGQDGDGWGLPVAYRDVVEVLADAGVPLRARQVCQAVGAGVEPRHREGCGSRSSGCRARLAHRGRVGDVRLRAGRGRRAGRQPLTAALGRRR